MFFNDNVLSILLNIPTFTEILLNDYDVDQWVNIRIARGNGFMLYNISCTSSSSYVAVLLLFLLRDKN
jgi:hypothetical protein